MSSACSELLITAQDAPGARLMRTKQQDDAHFFLWPIISPRTLRGSSRVRFLFMLGVSNEMCGISQRCSAINQTGFSVVIQLRRSKRTRFTGRDERHNV